ncbi:hypothetical protein D3C81_763600 [compost metagenome]
MACASTSRCRCRNPSSDPSELIETKNPAVGRVFRWVDVRCGTRGGFPCRRSGLGREAGVSAVADQFATARCGVLPYRRCLQPTDFLLRRRNNPTGQNKKPGTRPGLLNGRTLQASAHVFKPQHHAGAKYRAGFKAIERQQRLDRDAIAAGDRPGRFAIADGVATCAAG